MADRRETGFVSYWLDATNYILRCWDRKVLHLDGIMISKLCRKVNYISLYFSIMFLLFKTRIISRLYLIYLSIRILDFNYGLLLLYLITNVLYKLSSPFYFQTANIFRHANYILVKFKTKRIISTGRSRNPKSNLNN